MILSLSPVHRVYVSLLRSPALDTKPQVCLFLKDMDPRGVLYASKPQGILSGA